MRSPISLTTCVPSGRFALDRGSRFRDARALFRGDRLDLGRLCGLLRGLVVDRGRRRRFGRAAGAGCAASPERLAGGRCRRFLGAVEDGRGVFRLRRLAGLAGAAPSAGGWCRPLAAAAPRQAPARRAAASGAGACLRRRRSGAGSAGSGFGLLGVRAPAAGSGAGCCLRLRLGLRAAPPAAAQARAAASAAAQARAAPPAAARAQAALPAAARARAAPPAAAQARAAPPAAARAPAAASGCGSGARAVPPAAARCGLRFRLRFGRGLRLRLGFGRRLLPQAPARRARLCSAGACCCFRFSSSSSVGAGVGLGEDQFPDGQTISHGGLRQRAASTALAAGAAASRALSAVPARSFAWRFIRSLQ